MCPAVTSAPQPVPLPLGASQKHHYLALWERQNLPIQIQEWCSRKELLEEFYSLQVSKSVRSLAYLTFLFWFLTFIFLCHFLVNLFRHFLCDVYSSHSHFPFSGVSFLSSPCSLALLLLFFLSSSSPR